MDMRWAPLSMVVRPAWHFVKRTFSLTSIGAGPGGAGGMTMPGMPPGMPPIDPKAAMDAMQGVMKNPAFMQMAEKLGTQMMQDPQMASMMASMQDPATTEKMKAKMEALKEDPEMAEIMKEIETGGPSAMMKYWNDPKVLQKISGAMGDVMPGMGGGMPGLPGLGGPKMPGGLGGLPGFGKGKKKYFQWEGREWGEAGHIISTGPQSCDTRTRV